MAEEKRNDKSPVPRFVGSLTALTALSACVLTGIDPYTTVLRGIVAYAAGHFAGAVWDAIFGKREPVTIAVEYEVQPATQKRPENEDVENVPAEPEEVAA